MYARVSSSSSPPPPPPSPFTAHDTHTVAERDRRDCVECHSISIGKHLPVHLLIGLEFVRERRTVRTQIAPLLLRAPLVCAADQSAWLNTTAPLTRDAWNAMLSPDGKVSKLLLEASLYLYLRFAYEYCTRAESTAAAVALHDCHDLPAAQMLQRDTFYKAVYFGGIEQQMRRELWPFLLHHYELESTANERREIDRQMRRIYEEAMTEWCAPAHQFLHAPPRFLVLNTFFSSLRV